MKRFLNIWPIIAGFIHLFPLYTYSMGVWLFFLNNLTRILPFFFLLEWGENFTQGVLLQIVNENVGKVRILDI